jgi:hypothetical protein
MKPSACALLLTLSACSAQRVLFTPSAADRALISDPPLELSVSVTHWPPSKAHGRDPAAYAKPLAELLESSHAFRSVVYDPAGTAPTDLVAEPESDYCNSAIIPILTIVTVGIVPTVWTETECTGVSFRRHGASAPVGAGSTIGVHIRYEGKSVLGWAAAPLGALPGWSWKSGRDQPSYQQAMKVAIAQRRSELLRMAGK